MRSALIICITLIVASPAAAQDDRPEAQAGPLTDALAQCRAIAADQARLACFDNAAAKLLAARESGDVLILDREGMRRAKRRVFGFQLPRLGLFGNKDGESTEPEVREIDASISAVTSAGHGLYILTLTEGGQWQTLEGRTGFFPKSGQPIRIEAGILGSYNAKINESSRMVKVKRVR